MAVLTFVMQGKTPRRSLDTASVSSDEENWVSPFRLTARSSPKAIEAIGDLQTCFHNKASRKWAIEDLMSAYGYKFQNSQDGTPQDVLELRYTKDSVGCLNVDRLFSRPSSSAAYIDLSHLKELDEKAPAPKKRNGMLDKWLGNTPLPVMKKHLKRIQSEQQYNPFVPAVLIALAQDCWKNAEDKDADIQVHVVTASDQSPKCLRSYSARFSAAALNNSRGLFRASKHDTLEISCREVPLSPASEAISMLSKVFNSYERAFDPQLAYDGTGSETSEDVCESTVSGESEDSMHIYDSTESEGSESGLELEIKTAIEGLCIMEASMMMMTGALGEVET